MSEHIVLHLVGHLQYDEIKTINPQRLKLSTARNRPVWARVIIKLINQPFVDHSKQWQLIQTHTETEDTLKPLIDQLLNTQYTCSQSKHRELFHKFSTESKKSSTSTIPQSWNQAGTWLIVEQINEPIIGKTTKLFNFVVWWNRIQMKWIWCRSWLRCGHDCWVERC